MERVMCRLCLVENVNMFRVRNKNMQDVYQRLTDVIFEAEDSPFYACFLCFAKLKSACQLKEKCTQAEQLLTLMKNEPNLIINRRQLESGLRQTQTVNLVVEQIENIPNQQESPEVCQNQDDIIEPMCELQTDDKEDTSTPSQLRHELDDDEDDMQLHYESGSEHAEQCTESGAVVVEHDSDTSSPTPDPVQDENPVQESGRSTLVITSITEEPYENEIPITEFIQATESGSTIPVKSNLEIRRSNILIAPIGDARETIDPSLSKVVQASQTGSRVAEKRKQDILTAKNREGRKKNKTSDMKLRSRSGSRGAEKQQQDTLSAQYREGRKKNKIDMELRSRSEGRKKNKTSDMELRSRSRSRGAEKQQQDTLSAQYREGRKKNTTSDMELRSRSVARSAEQKNQSQNKTSDTKDIQGTESGLPIVTKQQKEKTCSLTCGYCQRRYKNKISLTCHIRSAHTGEKPYECDICKRTFCDKAYMYKHIRRHAGEKPYKCKTCQRRFTQSSDLTRHIRIHSGEQPHKCTYCNRRFTDISGLYKHIRTHSGEKPYKCELCDCCFGDKSALYKHILTHTGEKPYKCDVCQRSFNQNGNLKCHMRTHTNEKMYKCKMCRRRFNCKSNLNRHVRIHFVP